MRVQVRVCSAKVRHIRRSRYVMPPQNKKCKKKKKKAKRAVLRVRKKAGKEKAVQYAGLKRKWENNTIYRHKE